MSDDRADDTPAPPRQSAKRRGVAHQAGNADGEWLAVTSFPDYCRVGDKVIGFETTATLDNPITYSPNVKFAGRAVYREGDICKGTQGNAGSGIVSGTSGASGHVKFLTGLETFKVNGLPVVRHGSECLINCDANGVGGAKGYVYTGTRAVSSTPAGGSGPPTEAERLQQQAEANMERASELREVLNDNPSGKSAAQTQAVQAEVEELVQTTQQQQQAVMEAARDQTLTGDELVDVLADTDEAANRARDLLPEAQRQAQYASSTGKAVRGAGKVAAETLTPYGTVVDAKDTVGLFSQGRYGAGLGMAALTAVSIIPGVRLVRKGADAVDSASDAARGASKSGKSSDNANRTDSSSNHDQENPSPNPDEGVQIAGRRDGGQPDEEMTGAPHSDKMKEKDEVPSPDGGFTADLSKSRATSRSGHRNAGNKQLNDKMKGDPDFRADMERRHGSDVFDRTSTSGSGRRNPENTEWDHSSTNPDSLDLRTKGNHRRKTSAEGQKGGGWKRFHKE